MAATPYALWGDQRQWPLTPPGFIFIAPAFNRIGRAMKGDAWDDQYPAFAFTQIPPASPLLASEEMREYAHYELSEIMGDQYHADWSPLGSSGAGTGLGTLGTLAGIGSGSSALASLGSPQRGYRFTAQQWDIFRDIVRRRNDAVRDQIAMTLPPANWLYDIIAVGSMSPFLLRKSGGDWHQGNLDDWKMPTLWQVRERVRQTTMTPGNASSTAGSHYIFFQESELEVALKKIESPAPSIAAATLILPESDEGHKKATKPAAVAAAIDLVTSLLKDDPNATRPVLCRAVNSQLGKMSFDTFRGIYPDCRVAAGLPRKAPPGRPRKKPE